MKLLSRLVIALLVCLIAIPMLATPVGADPGISLNPSYGNVGKDVEVEGSFVSGEADTSVYVYYEVATGEWELVDSSASIKAATNTTATLRDASFAVPESCKGKHEVRVCHNKESDASPYISPADFTVEPSLDIDKEKGPAGTEVKVKGYGWDEDESKIEIRFYLEDPGTAHLEDEDYYVVVTSEDIDVDNYGSWEDVTFEVPPCSKGKHWIYAVGDETDDIKADKIKGVEFELLPGISLDIETGSPGDTVTVSGSGFEESESAIKVTYDGVVVAEVSKATEVGSWEATFKVLESIKGEHKIDASGYKTAAKYIEDKDFTVVPDLVLSPTEGHVGTSLTVNGSGFAGSSSVTITYDGSQKATATTNDKGSFSVSFSVPISKYGDHTITVNGISGKFVMESAPPPKPTLSSPATGERVGFVGRKFTPTFTWSAVTDDSGISHYVLEVASNQEFTTEAVLFSAELEEADLTIDAESDTVSYSLPEEYALPYGSYYWRVKAIDGAQNDSGWTVPYSFKSGILPFWALIAIAALLAVLIGVLVAFRRRAGYE